MGLAACSGVGCVGGSSVDTTSGSGGAGVGGAPASGGAPGGSSGGGVGGSITPGGTGGGSSGVGGAAGSGAGGAARGTGGSGVGGAGVGGTAGAAGVGTGGNPGTAGASGTGAIGQPIGFATLNGGTTGGRGAQVVTATTYDQLKSFAESTTPYIIMVSGTIANGPNGGKVSVKSNKSIIGVGSTAFLNGIGIEIANNNNIIIQNLRGSMTGVTTRTETAGVFTLSDDAGLPKVEVNDGDAISISGTSKNIWIDHCELFSIDPAVQTNIDLFDGLIDIKGQTGFITISWCYFHDHHKGGLVGASDTDLFVDRKITYHHNYYRNVKLRAPMYRGAVGHFFNNYIVMATDASEIRAATCIRMEKNYYEALHFSIYTPSDSPGSTERIDNIEVSRTARAYPANCVADIPYPYATALTTTTADVKTVVPQSAGVGKL